MKKSEKQTEQYLVKKIKAIGGLCFKWVSPGTNGVPDRIVILPTGVIHFVELKAEGKKNNLSALQRKMIERLLSFNCKCWILSSYEEVDEYIKFLEGGINGISTS